MGARLRSDHHAAEEALMTVGQEGAQSSSSTVLVFTFFPEQQKRGQEG